MPFVSPVSLGELPDGVTGEVLFRSTPEAWIRESESLMPDFQTYAETGFPAPTDPAEYAFAVALTGRFPSAFTDDTRPELEGAITSSVAEGRLVVIGSSDLVSDVMLDYARSPAGRVHGNNELLLQNLVDWSLADTDLLSIRSAGQFSRTLTPTDADMLFRIELANYVLVLLPLPILYAWSRRRRATPRLAEVTK
jgi:ABC-2 type transport system permease protein